MNQASRFSLYCLLCLTGLASTPMVAAQPDSLTGKIVSLKSVGNQNYVNCRRGSLRANGRYAHNGSYYFLIEDAGNDAIRIKTFAGRGSYVTAFSDLNAYVTLAHPDLSSEAQQWVPHVDGNTIRFLPKFGHSGKALTVDVLDPDTRLHLASHEAEMSTFEWNIIDKVTDPGRATVDAFPKPEMTFECLWTALVDDCGHLGFFQGKKKTAVQPGTESAVLSNNEAFVMATAKCDASVRLYDAQTGDLIWARNPFASGRRDIEIAAFTGDDQYVLIGGQNDFEVRVYEVATGDEVFKIALPDPTFSVESMAFSRDFSKLALGGNWAGLCYIWDTSDPDPRNWPDEALYVIDAGWGEIDATIWSENDEYFYTAGFTQHATEMRQYRVADFGQADSGLIQTYEIGNHIATKNAALSPDGNLIAGCTSKDAWIGVFDAHSGERLLFQEIPEFHTADAIEFTPDGKYLLMGGSMADYDRERGGMYVWRVADILNDDGDSLVAPVQINRWYDMEHFEFNDAGDHFLVAYSDGSARYYRVDYK